jgi:IS1 family transposase
MVVRIAGKRMYLWRAVDHEGEVLDMLVQRRRDSRAALRLMRKLLKKQGFAPKLLVTDKLRSYASAFGRLRLTCPHEQGLRKNNRRRTRISRYGDESARCSGLSPPVRPSASEHPRRGSQHLQPSTPSRLTINAPDLPSRGDPAVAKRSRRRVRPQLALTALARNPLT